MMRRSFQAAREEFFDNWSKAAQGADVAETDGDKVLLAPVNHIVGSSVVA